MTGYILRHEAHFRAVMEEQLRLESSEQIRIRRKRLERNENRIAELKRLFIRIYEDNACGRLSDGIDKLDGYALRELVSAIYVDAPDKSSGKRVQHIHIQYDGLGFIPLNELMKEETA